MQILTGSRFCSSQHRVLAGNGHQQAALEALMYSRILISTANMPGKQEIASLLDELALPPNNPRRSMGIGREVQEKIENWHEACLKGLRLDPS